MLLVWSALQNLTALGNRFCIFRSPLIFFIPAAAAAATLAAWYVCGRGLVLQELAFIRPPMRLGSVQHATRFTQTLAERQRHEARQQDFERDTQLRTLQTDTMLRANQLSDERVQTKRRLRVMGEMQKEQEMALQLEAVCCCF